MLDRETSGGRYGVGSSALTTVKGTKIPESVSVPESFSVPTLAPTRLSSLRASLPFVDIRALQHLRHSYPSRTADIAAPHLLIMPQLHLDALHAAASVLRIMLASFAARSQLHLVRRTLAVPLQAVFSIPCGGILC